MKCPKCKARIGIVPQMIASESGVAIGQICYMCGFWIEEYPKEFACLAVRADRLFQASSD